MIGDSILVAPKLIGRADWWILENDGS